MSITLTLGWNMWVYGIITVLFLLISLVLVLTILIQKPQGGGLAGAFGGAGVGSGQTAFGAKTGDALTVFTIIVFAVYVILAVVLNYAAKGLMSAPAPATTPATTEQPPAGPATAPSPGEQPAPTGQGGAQPGGTPVTPSGGG